MIATARGQGTDGIPDEAVQLDAERTFWQRALIGGAIGMALCSLLWAGIVAVALVGSGNSLGPVVWTGAAVGVFGGAFLGGWAGAMAGLGQLERTEHEILAERNRRDTGTVRP